MNRVYLETGEVKQMEEAAEYLRDKLLIRLLFRLGCRVSEALGIAVGDIDFKNRRVTIQHLKTRVKLSCPDCGARLSRAAKFCPGCGVRVEKTVREATEHRRQRALPIDEDTLEVLREFVGRPDGPVKANGRSLIFGISRGQAWLIVRRCAERAGLGCLVNTETGEARGISPHRLRDAHAIHAIKVDDSTDSVRLLQEMLGHKSIETTMRYRKVAGEELERWYEKLWNKEER